MFTVEAVLKSETPGPLHMTMIHENDEEWWTHVEN